MTLKDIYDIVEKFCEKYPNIHRFVDDFEKVNAEDNKYSTVILQQTEHQLQNNSTNITYNFYLGYCDRLTDDYSNKLDVHSTGIDFIYSLRNYLDEVFEINSVEVYTIRTGVQKFIADAGIVYCNIAINVPLSTCYTNYSN